MTPRPIVPRYELIGIALVILAGIAAVMLQDGSYLRKLIDRTCDHAHDCPPPVPVDWMSPD